ncbi:MAG TPA: response regulator [Candidatus Binataceae bacterium]|nr:response regulator [Candidatus Binataceae bacterium]
MAITTLIVDDSEETRAWLKLKLDTIGCEVVGEAENAAAGLRQFEALRPRLVILDIVMPDVEGVTAIDLFRHIIRLDSEVAVLVVSARPVADSHRFLKLGAIGYLEKPFIDFNKVAKLLTACFPEVDASRRANGSKRGLSARLRRHS